MYQLRIEATAVAEALEARAWYAARSPTTADNFDRDLDHALGEIVAAPMRWPTPWPGVHRCLATIPYLIAYIVGDPLVRVIAIAHGDVGRPTAAPRSGPAQQGHHDPACWRRQLPQRGDCPA